MSDDAFFTWAILWVGINAVIGYAIGKPKNEGATAVFASIMLGPIGWIIAMASKGHVRTCPFCAEQVKPEAKVCRFCGRDLPFVQQQSVTPVPKPSQPDVFMSRDIEIQRGDKKIIIPKGSRIAVTSRSGGLVGIRHGNDSALVPENAVTESK